MLDEFGQTPDEVPQAASRRTDQKIDIFSSHGSSQTTLPAIHQIAERYSTNLTPATGNFANEQRKLIF